MAQVAALRVVLFLAPHRVAVSAMATPVLHLPAPAATEALAEAQARRLVPAAVREAAMAVEVPASVVPAVAVEAVASAGREVVAVAVREAVVN